MSQNRRRRRPAWQPQTASRIDWEDPITEGLVAYINPAFGPINLVTGKPITSFQQARGVGKAGQVFSSVPNFGANPYFALPFELSGSMTLIALFSRDQSATSPGDTGAVAEIATNRTSGQGTFWELNAGNAYGSFADIDKPRAGGGVDSEVWLDGVLVGDESTSNPIPIALQNGKFYTIGLTGTGFQSSGSGLTVLGAVNISYGYFGMRGRFAGLLAFTQTKTQDQMRQLTRNIWRVERKRALRKSASSVVLAGAIGSQATQGTGGAASQAHQLTGAVGVQGAQGTGGSATQTHSLAGSVGQAASQGTTGSATQQHNLQGLTGVQATQGPGAALPTPGAAELAGAIGVQATQGTAGAAAQQHNLQGAVGQQATQGSAAAAAQRHYLQGAAGQQATQGVGAAAVQRHYLQGALGLQATQGSAGSLDDSAGVYVPAVIRFASPSRPASFASANRAQHYVSPNRRVLWKSPARLAE